MTKAANGVLHDVPSVGEIELFRKTETRFQGIFVVMNIAHLKMEGGTTPLILAPALPQAA